MIDEERFSAECGAAQSHYLARARRVGLAAISNSATAAVSASWHFFKVAAMPSSSTCQARNPSSFRSSSLVRVCSTRSCSTCCRSNWTLSSEADSPSLFDAAVGLLMKARTSTKSRSSPKVRGSRGSAPSIFIVTPARNLAAPVPASRWKPKRRWPAPRRGNPGKIESDWSLSPDR
jgi:hypothetical protein